jgi:hypothetical protein
MLPAVALLVKNISPRKPDPLTAVTKFCEIGPIVLFVMPVPLKVKKIPGSTVIVKECVSEVVKSIAAIVMLEETKREVTLDMLSNVAVSPTPVPG